MQCHAYSRVSSWPTQNHFGSLRSHANERPAPAVLADGNDGVFCVLHGDEAACQREQRWSVCICRVYVLRHYHLVLTCKLTLTQPRNL